ncbi:replication-relaxation family protein [Streptomyces sp. NPDC002306]
MLDQMYRLMAPGHKDNKGVRNACLDLAKHGLTLSEGAARDGNKLWGLTPLGLDAAGEVLGRGPGEMGSTARGAARSGAPHAMAVNETVITRTPPTATRPLTGTPATATAPTAVPAPQAVAAGMVEGIGSVFSWSTEVALNLPTSGRNRSGVRADAVLRASEAGVPVLLVEVDNCTETTDVLAAKFDKYLRFFRLKTKDHQEHDVPTWRLLYPPTGREGHPPVAVVYNPGTRLGPQALKNRMNTVMNETRAIWSGSYERMSGLYSAGEDRDGYYTTPTPSRSCSPPSAASRLTGRGQRCGGGAGTGRERSSTPPSPTPMTMRPGTYARKHGGASATNDASVNGSRKQPYGTRQRQRRRCSCPRRVSLSCRMPDAGCRMPDAGTLRALRAAPYRAVRSW